MNAVHANALFATVPQEDLLSFYHDDRLNPKSVADFLDLQNGDIAKLAGVAKSSVRFDDAIPRIVAERLEEIASICNTVATAFGGNAQKTALWFRTKNPMIGDLSPRDMIRFGRYDKLRRFVLTAIVDADRDRRFRIKRAEQEAGHHGEQATETT